MGNNMNYRYGRGQMMPRVQSGCDTCGNARTVETCETCSDTRTMKTCDDCGRSTRDELRGMPLAMAYVPWQNFECTYEPMQGLHAGTIFPELDKPFYGRRGMR